MKGLRNFEPMNLRLVTLAFAAASASVLCVPAFSQESGLPDISPDRPSVGTGPDVVPTRSLQMESGANVLYTKTGYVADLPETLMRLGVGGRTELRFSSSNWAYTSAGSTPAKMEFEDVTAGMKVGVSRANHWMVQSMLFQMSFPTGGELLTTGSVDPLATLIWQQNTAKGWSITENVGAVWTSSNGSRQTSFIPGVGVAHPLSKKMAWWAEYAPAVTSAGSMLNIVDGGFAYSLSGVRALDCRFGVERDASGVHNLVSAGYSFRMDRRHAGVSRAE